ncbi:MAG: sodium:proton antiporter [Bdellovibrionales bacterium]|nr:sodium:proton antiporter [Bdellovibrionales bacterium]
MDLFDIVSALLTLSALFGYINHRYLRFPTTIGIMLIALLFSGSLLTLQLFGLDLDKHASQLLTKLDFNETLMHRMLGFLLFAGALHLNLQDLIRERWMIFITATCGVVISTLLIGSGLFLCGTLLGVEISFGYCLLFGALISPTDPIAVLAILKASNVPKTVETKIAGESLFNDGVGVVLFGAIFGVVVHGAEPTLGHIAQLFLIEAVGGIALGLIFGYVAFLLLRSINNYQLEILITLALVMGGFSLAQNLHCSGLLAMAVAGLLIGNKGRYMAMDEHTREHLDTFWELVDEILNAFLFLLIGLELLVVQAKLAWVMLAILAIPLTLFARFACISLPVLALRSKRSFSPHVIKIMTWGGLRGGISVALALSLPAGTERELFLTLSYLIVIFSIAVQGLTIQRLVGRLNALNS